MNNDNLADRARGLGLSALLRLGRTEIHTGGADKDSILANTFEAVVGALYLDGGLEPVIALTRGWLDDSTALRDAKTAFQEWAHARLRETPSYHTIGDSGIENDEGRFEVEVRVDTCAYGRGTGRSKRSAEREAAVAAIASLGDDS